MANTQIGDILEDFLELFQNVFTIGPYINISDIPYSTNYYACVLLDNGDYQRYITNRAKYTINLDLIVYINNINNDYNTRLQYVLDNVISICEYDNNVDFRTFCGNYNLITTGKSIEYRTAQGLLLDKKQEMIVFRLQMYKD